MTANEIIQIVLFFGLGIALTVPVGRFMAKVFQGERTFLHPVLHPIEKLIYKLTGVDPDEEMTWLRYLWAVVLSTTVGFATLFAILFWQDKLPFQASLNPQGLPGLSWHLAFNTAWSFTCNADWQSYSGENTMSYFSQILGLSVHQFLSGASGIAVLAAVARGLSRKTTKSIGSFCTDLVRCTLYIVIPLSVIWSIPLMWQGCPETLAAYPNANVMEPYQAQTQKLDAQGNPIPVLDAKGQPTKNADGTPAYQMVNVNVTTQQVPLGLVASFESCKQLFTNGGGWYNVNSAHPLENPTPLSDFLEMLAIIIVPMAQVYMFGLMVMNTRHAWCVY